MQPEVEFLGFTIDSSGLHTSTKKVEAILQAPTENVTQLRSFLGLVNYYGRFLKNMSTQLQPLNNLLRKDIPWTWTKNCEKAFEQVKQKLSSAEVLVHYDPSLPVSLACDASSYGVGAVVSHICPDGTERPIAYGSRSLSSAERNYSQLALVFGVKRFHQYLYGREFALLTDHNSLTTILGQKQKMPSVAVARVQRWAILLSAYNYDLKYRKGELHGNADGLSRLPLGNCVSEEGSSCSRS